MASVKGASALLSLMSIVAGQYTCPSGYAGQEGTPLCGGVVDETCGLGQCCKLTGKLCSSENVVGGNAKCKTGSDKNYFFDLKKNAGVAASSSDADFVAACCTACTEATCADWQTVKALVGCGSGKYILGTNKLASADCSIPADDKYKEACCATTPVTCSSTNVLTGSSTCRNGPAIADFFDTKKAAVEVTSDSGSAFRSSCCTKCAEATCADWQPLFLLTGCGTGKSLKTTNALPSSDCAVPTEASYKETCCVTTATTCSATNAISGNTKCKGGTDVNFFFDLKKGTSVVASTSDADFRSACCSACTAATCADWATAKFLVSCGTGKSLDGTKVLASADCSIPADDAYKTACCVTTPTTCALTDAISGNAKCKGGTDVNSFFDLKKGTSVVASTSDDDFRSACCSACTAATCADWQPVKLLVGCGTGKYLKTTNALASADCSIPADDAYKTACCATTPKTCSSTNALTGNAQCKTGDPINEFFDLKKASADVTSAVPFRSACCTDCASATCADWQTVKALVGCGSGKYILGTNKLASSDCSVPADAKYKETCCATSPITCGTDVINGNSNCKKGSDVNYFFDLKKSASVVPSSSNDDFRATCCTACTQATCYDWSTAKPLVGCPSGKVISYTSVLSSSDCSIPADDKYKEACCQTPMKCADYDVTQDSTQEASAALPKAVASLMVLVGVHSLWI